MEILIHAESHRGHWSKT